MENKNKFEREILGLSKNRKEPEWIVNKRIECLKKFQKAQPPEFRYGISIILNTTGLDIENLNPLESLENTCMNIENADDDRIVVMDIMEAIEKKPDIIKEYFMKAFSPKDKFELFHSMFWNQGMLIYVPKGVEMEKPVHLNIEMSAPCQFNHILIIAEPMSKLSFVQTLSSADGKGSNKFRSEAVEIFVKEGAHVNYGSIQNLSQDVFNLSTKRAITGRDSLINWIDCSLGSLLSRAEVSTFLNGTGARTNNWGMFFGRGDQQFDLFSSSIHNAEQTTCDMLTKGALDDRSKAIYRGLVRINQNAGGSNGYQKEDTLLLSGEAEADPIPNLEIDNNNVKCSHGASVGQIDAEKMFYLMSRGLSEAAAKKSIVEGFFEPMIRGIGIEKTRNDLRNVISNSMESKKGEIKKPGRKEPYRDYVA